MTLSLEHATLLHQEQVVASYFQSFNRGDFDTTAQLFAATGQLLPPFEEPIIGPTAISEYLKREAEGMQANPKEMTVESLECDRRQVIVKGHVKAKVFQVNAAWIFALDPEGKIEQVRVKLLAALQDLMTLRN